MPKTTAPPAAPLTLWYRQPANEWIDALPLGNGWMAAMAFGGAPLERIQLNEESLWAGGPGDRTNPRARAYLDRMRRLLLPPRGKRRPVRRAAGR